MTTPWRWSRSATPTGSRAAHYKGVKAFGDFRELLELAGLDAVVIATPDHWHAIPCILAARAGKHIYCEKPLTHNIAEGRRIVDAVKKAKIVFQTGSQQRSEFGGHFRKAVEYVWNGRIGKVETVRIGVGGPAKPCDLPAEEVPDGTDWDLWLGPAPERAYNDDLCPKGVHQPLPGLAELRRVRRRSTGRHGGPSLRHRPVGAGDGRAAAPSRSSRRPSRRRAAGCGSSTRTA